MRPKEEIIQNFIVLFVVVFAAVAVFLLVYSITKAVDHYSQTVKSYRRRNKLYKCKHESCRRMYRKYQAELTESVKGKKDCPHCGERRAPGGWDLSFSCFFTIVDKEDEWMAHHIECPKITKREYFKIRQAIKTAKKLREDEEAIKRFEEYNKFSKDSHWIKNLYKNKE